MPPDIARRCAESSTDPTQSSPVHNALTDVFELQLPREPAHRPLAAGFREALTERLGTEALRAAELVVRRRNE